MSPTSRKIEAHRALLRWREWPAVAVLPLEDFIELALLEADWALAALAEQQEG